MSAVSDPEPESPGTEISNIVAYWIEQARKEGGLDITPAARCRVCRDPVIRQLVNAMISHGYTQVTVYEALGAYNRSRPRKQHITYDIICRHRREHYSLQEPANAIYRRMAEEQYLAEGRDLETGVGSIVTVRGFLETVLAKSYERLLDADEVDLDAGMRAASKLAEINRKDDNLLERAQMMADLNKAIGLMRKYVPVERWPALQAEMRGETPDQEVTQAQSVRMVEISDADEEVDD